LQIANFKMQIVKCEQMRADLALRQEYSSTAEPQHCSTLLVYDLRSHEFNRRL
jgi:hypothetical protein